MHWRKLLAGPKSYNMQIQYKIQCKYKITCNVTLSFAVYSFKSSQNNLPHLLYIGQSPQPHGKCYGLVLTCGPFLNPDPAPFSLVLPPINYPSCPVLLGCEVGSCTHAYRSHLRLGRILALKNNQRATGNFPSMFPTSSKAVTHRRVFEFISNN